MLTEALRKAAATLDREITDLDLGVPQFGDARYTAVPFDNANFRDLEPQETGAAMGFVDGGNLEVLHAPDFSVQLVRVCSVLFRNGERATTRAIPSRIEFLSVARAFPRDGEIFYSSELIPATGPSAAFMPEAGGLVISSRDDQLSSGRFRVDISVVGAAARRFAEWLVLAGLVERELGKGDIAVRDGTLQTAVRNESGPASKAFSAALEKGWCSPRWPRPRRCSHPRESRCWPPWRSYRGTGEGKAAGTITRWSVTSTRSTAPRYSPAVSILHRSTSSASRS